MSPRQRKQPLKNPPPSPPNPVTIATRLKRWRKVRGLSQGQAAPLLGITRRTLENWEQGINAPRGLALEALHTKLKMPNPKPASA